MLFLFGWLRVPTCSPTYNQLMFFFNLTGRLYFNMLSVMCNHWLCQKIFSTLENIQQSFCEIFTFYAFKQDSNSVFQITLTHMKNLVLEKNTVLVLEKNTVFLTAFYWILSLETQMHVLQIYAFFSFSSIDHTFIFSVNRLMKHLRLQFASGT